MVWHGSSMHFPAGNSSVLLLNTAVLLAVAICNKYYLTYQLLSWYFGGILVSSWFEFSSLASLNYFLVTRFRRALEESGGASI